MKRTLSSPSADGQTRTTPTPHRDSAPQTNPPDAPPSMQSGTTLNLNAPRPFSAFYQRNVPPPSPIPVLYPPPNNLPTSGVAMPVIMPPGLSLREAAHKEKNGATVMLPGQRKPVSQRKFTSYDADHFTSMPSLLEASLIPSSTLRAPSAVQLILAAATAGNVDAVRSYLQTDSELALACDANRKTPLMLAIENRHTELARFLLAQKESVERQAMALDKFAHNALFFSAQNGATEIAALLLQLDCWEWQTTKVDKHKVNALTAAIRTKHSDVSRLLLNCANADAQASVKNYMGRNALMVAAFYGDVVAVALILRLRSASALRQVKDQNGETALQIAIFKRRADILDLLSEENAPDLPVVSLANGASAQEIIDVPDSEIGDLPDPVGAPETRLFDAIVHLRGDDIRRICNQQDISALLLRHDEQGHTALMLALPSNDPSLIIDLLFNASDKDGVISLMNRQHQTVLMLAAAQGHTAMLATLLAFVSNKQCLLGQQSETGNNALMLAARAGHLGAVKLLLSQGSSVASQLAASNVNGLNVLMLAVQSGQQAVVECFLNLPQSATLAAQRNSAGLTARQIALAANHAGIASLLWPF